MKDGNPPIRSFTKINRNHSAYMGAGGGKNEWPGLAIFTRPPKSQNHSEKLN